MSYKSGVTTILVIAKKIINRRNQIFAMLSDSPYIEGEVPRCCPLNCIIIVQADSGTCIILPTMHRESANMADI